MKALPYLSRRRGRARFLLRVRVVVTALIVPFAFGCTGPTSTASHPSRESRPVLSPLASETSSPPARIPGARPSDAERPELILPAHLSPGSTVGGAVSLSPDGRLLASGSGGAIWLWDTATGHELRVLLGHSHDVIALAFSPDGRSLASAARFPAVELKFWDVATGTAFRDAPVDDYNLYINSLAFSTDGRWFAAASGESVSVWDLKPPRHLAKRLLPGRGASGARRTLHGIVFSPDGRWLAARVNGHTTKLWEVSTWKEVRELTGLPVAFSRDGRVLATDSHSKTVELWNVLTGQRLHSLPVGDAVKGGVFTPDGRSLVMDNELRRTVWDLATGRAVRVSDVLVSRQVAFSADARWGVSATYGRIDIWEVATARTVRSIRREDSVPRAIAFSGGGRWFAIGLDSEHRGKVEHLITLWDIAAGAPVHTIRVKGDRMAPLIALSPDDRWVAVGKRYANDISVRAAAGGSEVAKLNLDRGEWLESLAFAPDGRLLAAGSDKGSVVIWELPGKARHPTRIRHGGWRVAAVAFNHDGRRILSADSESVKVWEVDTGRELESLPGGRYPVFSADGLSVGFRNEDFYPVVSAVATRETRILKSRAGRVEVLALGGRWTAASPDDPAIYTWDAAPGAPRITRGHTASLTALAFSPDHRVLVSSSKDGSTRLWNPETGEQLATIHSFDNATEWLVATPDGLFDGSPSAWRRMLWRFGQRTFDTAPVEIFFNEFYYPGLLAEIMEGRIPRARRTISAVDRRQPEVKLSMKDGPPSSGGAVRSRSVTVRAEIAERPADRTHPTGSGARDVRLFRNGSLVKAWRGDVLAGAGGRAVLETTLPIVAGENRLTAYAFNRDNVKSGDAELVITGAESLARPGTAYIVAIGVDRYASPDYNLRYAVADARTFAEEMRRQQIASNAFPRVEVITLFDEHATKANVLEVLQRLAGTKTGPVTSVAPDVLARIDRAQPEDAVFVYFSGHGTAHGPTFYLIPHDLGSSDGRSNPTEAGLRRLLAHSISDSELERVLEQVDASRLLLVIDACNSGQALEAEEKRRGPMNSRGLAQLAYEKGMYVLAAAQGYQAALEAERFGHGLLTYALVEEGLKTPAADTAPTDGQVNAREWFDYAVVRVPQLQTTLMEEARRQGRELAFVDGEATQRGLDTRSLQRPRAFYRRDAQDRSLVVAKPEAVRR